jgi:hypothetical protein
MRTLLGLAMTFVLLQGAVPAALAQDRLWVGDRNAVKGIQDVKLVVGKITEENKERLVVKTGAGNQNIPAATVIEVTYQLPPNKTKAAAIYKKAEDTVQLAAQTAAEAKRKELLGEAIKLFESLRPEVQDLKTISRHVQFKIASISAQRAAGDRELTLKAIELLEKYIQDHPDSWQTHYGANLLAQLKGK